MGLKIKYNDRVLVTGHPEYKYKDKKNEPECESEEGEEIPEIETDEKVKK